MDLAVTGLAEGYEVVPCMSSTLGQRCLVVYLLGGNEPALLLAQLTEGVLCYIAVADAFPCASVPTAYSRVSVILLVAFGFLLCVFLAEPAIRQLGTSGVGTRSFRFSWHFISPPAEYLAQLVLDDVPDLFQVADLAVAHLNHSFPGIRKALQDCSHKASVIFSFAIIIIS